MTSNGTKTVINQGEEDFMLIEGFQRSLWRVILIWICTFCTCGILLIVFYWRPSWYIKLTHTRVSPEHADAFVLEDAYMEVCVSYVYNMTVKPKSFFKCCSKTESLADKAGALNLPIIAPEHGGTGEFETVNSLKYFDCKRVRYIWNPKTDAYEKLVGLPNVPLSYFGMHNGLDDTTRSQRLHLFGPNDIAVEVDNVLVILFREGITPFYAFQLFAFVLWFYEPYTIYASVLVAITCLSLGSQVYVTWSQQMALRKRVQDYDMVQVVKADGTHCTVPSQTLVPGDVVLINSKGGKVVCDMVLISGNCIVNEASLTGESIPVPKVPVVTSEKDVQFSTRAHNRHILFCGTHVLQSREGEDGTTRALVVRSGFMTAKGELIRSIMFFRQVDFKFQNQTFWYILALASIAVIGMIYSLIILITNGAPQRDIVTRTLDLITIVVPPALPAALTTGIIFSQWRLKKHRIFCISPRTINMCGLINLCCFDKTGTLTEEGLDLKQVLSSSSNKGGASFQNTDGRRYSYVDVNEPIVRTMAACHSLSLIYSEEADQSKTVTTIGDPLDLIMFNCTHWKLEERIVQDFGKTYLRVVYPAFDDGTKKKSDQEVIILREFPFASQLQRMGTVAYSMLAHQFEYYAKGATEKILSLCNQATIPHDCLNRLEEFSSQGNRVIALAWKSLESLDLAGAAKISRADAESNMTFVGLIIFENRLKPDSADVIEELYNANIRNVMLTGDNLHTAIAVARTCGFIRPHQEVQVVHADESEVKFVPQSGPLTNGMKHFDSDELLSKSISDTTVDVDTRFSNIVLAMTGDNLNAIKKFHPVHLPKIVLQGTVFARVSPLEKQYMVERFQEAGYQVAMCGDGANDCGALRAAHAGISLSESEAAAAAPFTSTNPSIACVTWVLREGRCALVTFFGIFFLMATYSMCQFISVVLIYWYQQTLTDMQFLYEDLFELTILAIVIACAKPYTHLTKDHTPSSLKSFPALFSLIGHVLLLLGAQILAFELVQTLPCIGNTTDPNNSTIITATGQTVYGMPQCDYVRYGVWPLGTLQIVFLSFIFAKGPPFRMPFYTNYIHVILAVGMVIFDLVCMLGPTAALQSGLPLVVPMDENFGYRFVFLGIAIGYLILALCFEQLIVNKLVIRILNSHPRYRKLRSLFRGDVEDDLRKAVMNSCTPKHVAYNNAAYLSDSDFSRL